MSPPEVQIVGVRPSPTHTPATVYQIQQQQQQSMTVNQNQTQSSGYSQYQNVIRQLDSDIDIAALTSLSSGGGINPSQVYQSHPNPQISISSNNPTILYTVAQTIWCGVLEWQEKQKGM